MKLVLWVLDLMSCELNLSCVKKIHGGPSNIRIPLILKSNEYTVHRGKAALSVEQLKRLAF